MCFLHSYSAFSVLRSHHSPQIHTGTPNSSQLRLKLITEIILPCSSVTETCRFSLWMLCYCLLSTLWQLCSLFSAGLRFFSGNYRCSFNREQEADGKRIYITSVHWDHSNIAAVTEHRHQTARQPPVASPRLDYIVNVTIELQTSSRLRLWPIWPGGGLWIQTSVPSFKWEASGNSNRV